MCFDPLYPIAYLNLDAYVKRLYVSKGPRGVNPEVLRRVVDLEMFYADNLVRDIWTMTKS